MLKLGKVVAVHPQDQSVDLVMLEDMARVVGAQVLCDFAGTDFGESGLAEPTGTIGSFDPALTGDRDILAVCGLVRTRYFVLGFVYPQINQMLFADAGRRVNRHPSDVYTSTDSLANFEFFHPSGAYVRMSTSTAHEDLTGKDVDGKWAISKNTAQKVHIHVEQAGGLAVVDIDTAGKITITTQSDLAATATGNVSVQAGQTATVKGASIVLDGPASCTSNLAVQGNITAQGGVAAVGPISSDTDVIAGPEEISLVKHPHTSSSPGSPTSPALPTPG